MKRIFVAPVIAGACILALSCSGIYAGVIAERMTESYLAIPSYRGVLVEEGAFAGADTVKLISDVAYRAVGKMRAEVREPDAQRGDLFLYDGQTVTLWWPRELVGVRVTGAPAPSPESLEEAFAENTRWSLRNYAFSQREEETKAGRASVHWVATPVAVGTLLPYESWLDAVTSLPLAVRLGKAEERPWYAMSFRDLKFGAPVGEEELTFSFPANAVVFEWDLRDPEVPREELQKEMNFEILLPGQLPAGHRVNKLIRGRHCLPMVAVLMDQGARWLSLTESRDVGLDTRRGAGLGVDLGGERRGVLRFLGTFTVLSWSQRGTALTLLGNVPYPELLAVASSVGGQ